MGTPKETQTADGLCPRQILGAPPPAREPPCSHPPHGVPQKPFPKRFLRSFFLKKATLGAAAPLRAAAPPARRRPAPIYQPKKELTSTDQLLVVPNICEKNGEILLKIKGENRRFGRVAVVVFDNKLDGLDGFSHGNVVRTTNVFCHRDKRFCSLLCLHIEDKVAAECRGK